MDFSADFSVGRITEENSNSDLNEPRGERSSAEETVTPQTQYAPTKSPPSRVERQIKKRLSNFDATQSKITDFYNVCEVIKEKITETPILFEQIQCNIDIISGEEPKSVESSLDFFEMLQKTSLKKLHCKIFRKINLWFSLF